MLWDTAGQEEFDAITKVGMEMVISVTLLQEVNVLVPRSQILQMRYDQGATYTLTPTSIFEPALSS